MKGLSKASIIRAWKDEEFRNSLSAEERALLPENPVGVVELSDDEIADVSGGLQLAAKPRWASFTGSWLCNCRNISEAMSATSTCCCFSSRS